MPLILSGNVATALGTGYDVANSCRFNDDDNSKMVVTPSSSGTNAGKKYTLSAWVKFGNPTVDKTIWSCSTDTYIYISGAGVITCNFRRNGSTNFEYGSSKKLRDPTAWYHIVLRVDTTDSTDADKVQVYVNGVEDTPATTTYQNMADDYETGANVSGVEQRIGVYSDGSLDFDGYMCEVMMVDNQSLAPTEFGEYDEDTPTIWKPKDISGISVGTNGYYLDFEDSSNLGNNAAGSGSADLTETNLAATDQGTDTCTNNFATFNPLDRVSNGTNAVLSEGNCKAITAVDTNGALQSTLAVSSGKFYAEFKISKVGDNLSGGRTQVGVGSRNNDQVSGYYYGNTTSPVDSYGLQSSSGNVSSNNGNTNTSYGDTFVDDDIIGVHLDLDNNKLYFSENGTLHSSTGISITAAASTLNGHYHIGVSDGSANDNGEYLANYGGCPAYAISSAVSDDNGYGSFEYSPNITGDSEAKKFYSLCTKNIAEFGG